MNADFGYMLAFVTGIMGAFHCLGMCSGINGGFFAHYGRFPGLSPVISFHGMRIAVYTLLGIAGALMGHVLVQTGIVGKFQSIMMIGAGILVILIGLKMIGVWHFLLHQNKQKDADVQIVKFIRSPESLPRFTPAIAGFLNGLVPCSLVFSVAIQAAATADPARAGLIMLAFGAGTLPSMGALSLLSSYIGTKAQGNLARLAGVTVLLLGLWTLYEGVVLYDVMRGLANW